MTDLPARPGISGCTSPFGSLGNRHLWTYLQSRLVSAIYISEFEGVGKNSDPTRWGSFTDVKGIEKEMLERLDAFFKTWLSP